MERLTERSENGKAVYRHPTPEPVGWESNRSAVLEKCCCYEDTGLEPFDIPILLDRLKRATEQWNIWCDAYQKDVSLWIPITDRLPKENEYRVVCTAHCGKPFLRRFEVAYITDTIEYQFGYYDGYKWIDKLNIEILNVVAWKIHEPFIPQK